MTRVYNVFVRERAKNWFTLKPKYTTYYVEAESEQDAIALSLKKGDTLLQVRQESECIVTGVRGVFNQESGNKPVFSYVHNN